MASYVTARAQVPSNISCKSASSHQNTSHCGPQKKMFILKYIVGDLAEVYTFDKLVITYSYASS